MSPSADPTQVEVARPLSPRKHSLLLAPFALALVIVAIGGYLLHWRWTGYLSTEDPSSPTARTLWDWLSLLLQPLVLAFVPIYFKLRGSRSAVWSFLLLCGALILGVLVVGGYASGWGWTGFEGNTLWDWLGLFLVPFLLPLALLFLDPRLERGRADVTPDPREPRVRPPLRHRSWSPARTTAIVGGLIIAGFTGGWIAHIPAHKETPPAAHPTVAAGSRLNAVTVNARDVGWTDTFVRVRRGQRLEISAFGLARSSTQSAPVGPAGERRRHPPSQSIVPAFPHLALLATVAPPGAQIPLADPLPSERVIDVGPDRVFTSPSSGELFLAVNDTGPDNNEGWFGATVRR